ncbi:MAG: amidohydrolase [Acidimicrobiia bacterium]|nr:amidohydrolase [Acidimicrobiia bacterium]
MSNLAADRIAIINAQIVTVDKSATVIENGSLVVGGDGSIRAISSTPIANNAPETIDAGGAIVMPGLINAHTHLGMTLFRGLGDDMSLEDFLARLMPAEVRVLNYEAVHAGTELAALESLLGGITTSLDMYYLPDAAVAVAKSSGMRLQTGPNFLESDGPEPLKFDDRLKWATKWLEAPRDMIGTTGWVAPHSTYLLSEAQLRTLADLAAKFEARIHVHASETVGEMQLVAKRHGGRTPIQVLGDTNLLRRSVLAHGVHLTDDDIKLIAQNAATVVHCPASNFKLASGVARILDLQRAGVNVALGTDGPASGNDIDLWIAIRLAGYMQKTFAKNPAVLPAIDIVRMATINGARALQLDHMIGSLEVGKRADLIVLDADSPSLTPNFDPHTTIATSVTRADVRHVLVDGKIIVRDRKCLTVDHKVVVDKVRALGKQVLASVGNNQ